MLGLVRLNCIFIGTLGYLYWDLMFSLFPQTLELFHGELGGRHFKAFQVLQTTYTVCEKEYPTSLITAVHLEDYF